VPITLDSDLERLILLQIESGRYVSPAQVVEEGLELTESRQTGDAILPEQPIHDDPPIWEVIVALGEAVPPEAWANVPTDLSKQVDHYLYGAPKQPE
jgi:Arc/MetJ-type ribon-helix-helix transcriptional regulator